MTVGEFLLAVLLPPVAVALHKGTRWWQVPLDFALWVFGWFPGVIYALWNILPQRDLPYPYRAGLEAPGTTNVPASREAA